MRCPEIEYMSWAKRHRAAAIDLTSSGAPPCPLRLLAPGPGALAIQHEPGYGWPPLLAALAARYRVPVRSVLPVSGGTSLANWLACAAVLEGGGGATEVIVERPTYEPLHRLPRSLGCRVRRLERRLADGYALDLEALRRLVNRRTRLLILSDLHNPSGARLDRSALRAAAELLAGVGGFLLIDEVYLESTWAEQTASAVRAAPNVVTTSSLTKAYGLGGLRAGWLLAPPEIADRARRIHDYLGVNGVAPGERLTVLALRRLARIRARVRPALARNLESLRALLAAEPRLRCHLPPGGTVAFPRLPAGLDGDAFADHLRRRYATAVVPGRFFEAPRHVRIGLTAGPATFRRGLANLRHALDDLLGEGKGKKLP
jgi:aspartate/methionine/tyrosine aminotransferase